ncbi:proline dioxygenase [Comamonas serinivorans]|uniref:Proline dioxygenase n=1 Tax=Comamonas serinivorans TaxID=1082851 RepID=A0A1Y0ENV6_9BURK|nr:2OG-Fe(II) oxygenase [Comamonas serinivorans]ARU05325.1 proline dioxygenase [Comamonas serinivorans]
MNQSQQALPQTITPELREWIVAQAQSGHTAQAVLDSMLAAGWQEEVAIEAMETTLRAHLEEMPAGKRAQAAANQMPPASRVPDADLGQSPLFVDTGDRRVAVLSVMQKPRIVVFGDFLSGEECDALVAAARPRMARSMTVANATGGEEVHADRTSDGMFFQRGETEVVRRIEARIARLLRWPVENGEGLQVLHYRPGAEYKPHYDYFDPAQPGTSTILKRGGQRVGTLLMYLNDPEKGGGTVFPDAGGFEVAPKRGHAVFFSYERPHPSTKSLHGGTPVIAGEKWVATKWLREGEFN